MKSVELDSYLCWKYIHMQFKADKEEQLLDLIIRKMGYHTKTKARNFIKGGSVMVDGKVVSIPSKSVAIGQVIETGPKVKKRDKAEVEDIIILYEDEYMIIADKPTKKLSAKVQRSGALSFTDEVDQYIKGVSANKLGAYPINYLAKDLSGYMIFSKKKEYVDKIKAAWKKAYKSYYVVVEGKAQEELVTHTVYLKENEYGKMIPQDKKNKYVRKAIIHQDLIKAYKRPFTALEIRPDTQVKDQERAILKSIGHPIVGDNEYPGESNRIKRLAMHNWKLRLIHPFTRKTVNVTAVLPKRMLDF